MYHENMLVVLQIVTNNGFYCRNSYRLLKKGIFQIWKVGTLAEFRKPLKTKINSFKELFKGRIGTMRWWKTIECEFDNFIIIINKYTVS
jgi:hypothetical protein